MTKQLLDAGAVLPDPVADISVPLSARTYGAEALGDRVVVRLVPDALGEAEDLALDVLGLSCAGVVPVGHARRQALGFPAWALVHDPANARHALALVQDLERGARLATSKAGQAKDLFDGLAARLGRSAPHFLPTLLEQAGRAFVEAGNRSYAAMMFGKAREAERVHSLAVDEDRQREVFLEFAFAGALSAKALSEEARELARRSDPDQAYDLFRRLCVERCLGGLPPYASMATDLRRMAKAAGRRAAEEDDRIVRDLLAAPTTVAAPAGFWSAYAKVIARLGQADEAIRAQLLRIYPSGWSTDDWLELLEAAGALDDLRSGRIPAAGWLEGLIAHRAMGWRSPGRSPRLLALAEQLAPSFPRDRPMAATPTPHLADLDLLDVLVAADVPVALPEHAFLRLDPWLRDRGPGRRDLSALAADAVVGPLLTHAAGDAVLTATRRRSGFSTQPEMLSAGFLEAIAGAAGVRAALGRWVAGRVGEVLSAPLGGAVASLVQLTPLATAEAAAANPSALQSLASWDAAEALAATLRGGILDELGWPALDEAVERRRSTAGPNPQQLGYGGFGYGGGLAAQGSWPQLVLVDRQSATVVGPDGIELEHTFRIPPDRALRWGLPRAIYVDGTLLVTWDHENKSWAYWSSDPRHVFELPDGSGYGHAVSVPLPGGGRTLGGRALHPGDPAPRLTERPVLGDGGAWWVAVREENGNRTQLRELDPATGTLGRRSLPTALDEAPGLDEPGAALVLDACELLPVQPGLASTPLGTAGGLLGWRLVARSDGSVIGTGVDGRRLEWTAAQQTHASSRHGRRTVPVPPAGLLHLPGGAELVLSVGFSELVLGRVSDGAVVARIPVGAGRSAGFAAGSALVPPARWLHCLRPRDERASLRLRSVRQADVVALVAASREALPPGPPRGSDSDNPAPATAAETSLLDRLLPRSDARLRAGVLGWGRAAAAAQALAASLAAAAGEAETRAAGAEDDTAAAAAAAERNCPDDVLQKGLGGLTQDRSSWYSSTDPGQPGALRQVAAVRAALDTAAAGSTGSRLGRLFRRREPVGQPDLFPETAVPWPAVVGTPAALLLRAAGPATPVEQRTALLTFVEALADADLTGSPAVRALYVRDPKGRRLVLGQVMRSASAPSVLVRFLRQDWDQTRTASTTSWLAIESGPRAGSVADLDVVGEEPLAGVVDPAHLRAAAAEIRRRGSFAWDPSWAARLSAATGLSEAEATLLLVGLPGIDSYEHNFLDKAVREALGLKAADAKAAQRSLTPLSVDLRRRLLAAALPADPVRLWTDGPDVDAVADVFVRLVGRRVAMPAELLTAARRELPALRDPAGVLRALADPDACPWLTAGTIGRDELVAVALAVPWMAYQLPLGSPIRTRLSRAVQLTRQRLTDPALRVQVGWGYSDAYRQLLGVGGSTGPVSVGPWTVSDEQWKRQVLTVAPAGLTEADQLLTAVCAMRQVTSMEATAVPDPAAEALRLLLPGRLPRLADHLAAPTTRGSGDWEQDPAVSAPEVVGDAAGQLGVSPDAARLYLQTLVLPDPTKKNVLRWNGWTSATYGRAEKELLSAGHLLGAERARAGRKSFLPGGWLNANAPDLPLEAWTAALLDVPVTDRPVPLLGRIVVTEPLGELFARGWARWTGGDRPALEELRTGRQR